MRCFRRSTPNADSLSVFSRHAMMFRKSRKRTITESRRTLMIRLSDGSEREFGYVLKKSTARRSVTLTFSMKGLRINAPARITESELENCIGRRLGWISKHAEEFLNAPFRATENDPFGEGRELPYRGKVIRLALGNGLGIPMLREASDGCGFVLSLPLPKEADPEEVEAAAKAWYREQAKRVLRERFDHVQQFAPVPAAGLRIISAKSLWGSCSADGRIHLNWRLIFFENDTIDYVAAHELAHLVSFDHSPAFWHAVRTIKPNYEKNKAKLRELRLAAFPFSD